MDAAARSHAVVRILGGTEVRQAATELSRACAHTSRLCRGIPLPAEEVFKAADSTYADAYMTLIASIRYELDWVAAQNLREI